MLRWLRVPVAVLAMGGLLSCGDDDPVSPPASGDPVATFSADVAVQWFGLILDLTQTTPGYSPPIASRTFGYSGVALYESLLPGMDGFRTLAGQLNGLGPAPAPEAGMDYYWPAVANAALATMVRFYYPSTSQANLDAIDDLEASISASFSGVDAEVLARSASRGQSVATHVYAWSVSDGGHEGWTRNFPTDYDPPTGDGLWIPTPQLNGNPPQRALLPYWGMCRPFVLPAGDPNLDCDPGAPPAYSTDPGSDFYAEAAEVYDAVENLTQEQLDIALFWADNPGETATPPGHSVSVLNQVLVREGSSLETAADAYARLGMATADAFISCWESKYRYNLIRPVSYIREVWGLPDWLPPVNTPPFPEYTSGHSVQSGAAFQVLTDLFGDDYAMVDHTHDGRGLTPRSFDSFNHMAEEAAISRLYGGIHYRAAIDLGVSQGRCVAARIAQIVTRMPS